MGKNTRHKERKQLDKQLILSLIGNFSKKRVLVIGDSILDLNTYTTPLGFALETPTPKYKKEKKEFAYGGAANVVNNILGLGAKCTFITVIGNDNEAEHYDLFKNSNLNFMPVTEIEIP